MRRCAVRFYDEALHWAVPCLSRGDDMFKLALIPVFAGVFALAVVALVIAGAVAAVVR